MQPATLVFVIDAKKRKILLGIKTRKIGANMRNGAGGGIKPGEQPKAGAIRETREETHL